MKLQNHIALKIRYGVAVIIVSFSGCATVVNGPTQAINVKTTPPGATCDVGYVQEDYSAENFGERKSHWQKVTISSIMTPGIVVLKKNKQYFVDCHMAGYVDTAGNLEHKFKDWDYFILGNLFAFGLLPGMVVDLYTGGANSITPQTLQLDLKPSTK